ENWHLTAGSPRPILARRLLRHRDCYDAPRAHHGGANRRDPPRRGGSSANPARFLGLSDPNRALRHLARADGLDRPTPRRGAVSHVETPRSSIATDGVWDY